MTLPLEGITVLDLSMRLAGPVATQMLGDLGARVIKLEPPGGDESRKVPPFYQGVSTYYLGINRNKDSIVVDLKHPRGRQVVLDLVRRADVFLENFRPGVVARLGIDYPSLQAVNPRLIYGSITGFGASGPYAQRPAYDLVAQALSGHMTITGEPGRPPQRIGVSMGDILAGHFAVQGILAALYWRERTGAGQHIRVSLLDSLVAVLTYVASSYLLAGETTGPTGNSHPYMVPQQGFRAADRWLIAIGHNGAFWTNFCKAINRPDLEHDPRFCTLQLRTANKAELLQVLEGLFLTRTAAEWVAEFVRHGVPAAPVQDVAEALNDPQVAANGMIWAMEHPAMGPVRAVGNPLNLSAHPDLPARAPRRLGEDTEAVLREHLGFSPEEVRQLLAEGAVRGLEAETGSDSE